MCVKSWYTFALDCVYVFYVLCYLYLPNTCLLITGGCVDPEEMAEAAEGHLVLKKVLNIIFLVIGSLLFAAVFVVIIYTSVGKKSLENTQPLFLQT